MTIYQVTHKATYFNQQIRNVFYYETDVGDPSSSEWQDVVDEIRADLILYLITSLVPEYIFNAIDVREVSTAGLPSAEYLPTLGSAPGTSAADGIASQVALLGSVQGLTSKPRRARTYLTGFAEGGIVNGLWAGAILGNAKNFLDVQDTLNAAGTNPLNRVSVQWNASHTLVTVWNNIQGRPNKISTVPATQRRRRIGVGI